MYPNWNGVVGGSIPSWWKISLHFDRNTNQVATRLMYSRKKEEILDIYNLQKTCKVEEK